MVKGQTILTLTDGVGTEIWSRRYNADELLRIFGLGAVEPGKSRIVRIPLSDAPADILSRAVGAKLEVRPNAR